LEKEKADALAEEQRLEEERIKDLAIIESFNITDINITMTLSLTKMYRSYCIFNISHKLPIKASHRKVA
jgi:hypothetical protein